MTRFFANYSDYVPSSAVTAGLIAFAAGFVAHRILHRRSHTSHANVTNVRSTTASGSVVYESSRAVDEYLLFHYLPAKQLCPYELAPHSALDFPKRCADLCATHVPKGKPSRALDVGCAVGRHSFEMAKVFDEVIGLDFSHAFVNACDKMKAEKSATVPLSVQGDIRSSATVSLPPDCIPHASKARFVQGDACDLPPLGQFDCVLAANLLCRLPNPAAFLDRLPAIIKPGGVLVLVSPYSWLEEYTPKANWIGGVVKAGVDVFSAAAVSDVLSAHFDKVSETDMPFLIREHSRKFQWGCSHAVVWRRK